GRYGDCRSRYPGAGTGATRCRLHSRRPQPGLRRNAPEPSSGPPRRRARTCPRLSGSRTWTLLRSFKAFRHELDAFSPTIAGRTRPVKPGAGRVEIVKRFKLSRGDRVD